MPHDDGFPGTCTTRPQDSKAIRFLDVDCENDGGVEQPLTLQKMRQMFDQQKYRHFVQVEWKSGSGRLPLPASPCPRPTSTQNLPATVTTSPPMPHDDGFPATCTLRLQDSRAIRFLDVDCAQDGGVEQPLTLKKMRQKFDKQKYRHFVQVGWNAGNSGGGLYLYAATPAFARRLQGVIQRVHEAHARDEKWSGKSIGQMIQKALKQRDLIKDQQALGADGLVSEVARAAWKSPSARYRAQKRADADRARGASQEKTQTMTPAAVLVTAEEDGRRGECGGQSCRRLNLGKDVIEVD
eukprot:CAMPEP_0173126746 /NCGR_PEP_ID=MMETSP1102-20130122/57354_1 /TAXON_ID=49646 /ORGANISM="Geminigera sp., Strain Caron Lab Isolate" /LENGTH=295 /DNA_ID=CAMNT_0014036181 /DNA_START=77 /DNA_END=964 /DNA_ORIENTATION=+